MTEIPLPQLPPQEYPCDGCSACCHTVGVIELGKPDRCDCEHLSAGGCRIYGQHPPSCKVYQCGYALGLLGSEFAHRPDKSGVLFHPSSCHEFFVYLAHDAVHTRARALDMIERLKKRYQKWVRRRAIAQRPSISDAELLEIEHAACSFTLVPARYRTPLAIPFSDRYPMPSNTAFTRSLIADGIFVVGE